MLHETVGLSFFKAIKYKVLYLFYPIFSAVSHSIETVRVSQALCVVKMRNGAWVTISQVVTYEALMIVRRLLGSQQTFKELAIFCNRARETLNTFTNRNKYRQTTRPVQRSKGGAVDTKDTTKIRPKAKKKLPTESYGSREDFVIALILREPDSPSFPIPFILSSEYLSSDRSALLSIYLKSYCAVLHAMIKIWAQIRLI